MADLCLWNLCNNNCIMCTNPVGFRNKKDAAGYSFEEIAKRLKKNIKEVKKSEENINLTGGEPTIHPDFFKLLKWLRDKFPKNKIVLITNARMFSYPKFAKECLKIPNIIFEVSIHGYDALSHDSITRVKGSFEQATSGLKNILSYKNSSHEVEVRMVIIKQNYQNLSRMLRFIKSDFSQIDRVVLVFEEIEGIGEKNFKIVGITYKQAREFVEKAVKESHLPPSYLRLYHFPLCALPPKLWKYTWRTLGPEEVTFLSSCRKCLYKKYCLGIHKGYLKVVGSEEFQPIKKKMAIISGNSFFWPIQEVKIIDY